MINGTLSSQDSDNVYFGLKEEVPGGDRQDAVISWGDNPSGALTDYLRFIVTAPSGNGLPGTLNGQEVARFLPNGNAGIGNFYPPSNLFFPRNRLDVQGSAVIGSAYAGNVTVSPLTPNSLLVQNRVGIGTTNPLNTLHVNGTARVVTLPSATTKLVSADASNVLGAIAFPADATKVLLGNGTFGPAPAGPPTPEPDWLVTGNNMSSIPSDNVGVGVTPPTAKLHVRDDKAVPSADTVLVEFPTSSSIGVDVQQLQPPKTNNGQNVGVNAQTSIDSSGAQKGTAAGRLGLVTSFFAAGNAMGVQGIANPDRLQNFGAGNVSNGTGGWFQGAPTGTGTLTLGGTGTYWVGGTYSEVSGLINNSAQIGGAVAAVIGVDNTTGTTATHYAGYFGGKVRVTNLPPNNALNNVVVADASGVLQIRDAATLGGAADVDWSVSGSDMTSIPTGNVGVGTTPAQKLDVNGIVRVRQLDAAATEHVCRDAQGDLSTCDAQGGVQWITATLGNGCSPSCGGSPVQYYKDAQGRVYLRGALNNVAGCGSGTPFPSSAFNLPVGFRPTTHLDIGVRTYPHPCNQNQSDALANDAGLFINTAGEVLVIQWATGNSVRLDGISFTIY